MRVNILGTFYSVEVHRLEEDNYLREENLSGYCSETLKKIVVVDYYDKEEFENMSDEDRKNTTDVVLRHEVVHAFLNESGLSDSSMRTDGAWAKCEEVVDWIAIQGAKIYEAWKEIGVV